MRKAKRLSENRAPPNIDIAIIGVKLGGCGINLEIAAIKIKEAAKTMFCLFCERFIFKPDNLFNKLFI
jgi:hypothetical protein